METTSEEPESSSGSDSQSESGEEADVNGTEVQKTNVPLESLSKKVDKALVV